MSEPPLDTGDIKTGSDPNRAILICREVLICHARPNPHADFKPVAALLRDEAGCEQAARWLDGHDDCPILPVNTPFLDQDDNPQLILSHPRGIGKLEPS